MKVILIKNVPRVGSKGLIVEVSEGYGRNFLIRNGLAQEADSTAIKQNQDKQRQKLRQQEAEKTNELNFAVKHKKAPLIIVKKANEHGHLFEKINSKKIIEILNNESGASFSEKQLVDFSIIQEIGNFEIKLKIGEKLIPFKINITAEQ